MTFEIDVLNDDGYPVDEARLRAAAEAVLAAHDVEDGSAMSIMVTTDEAVAAHNRQFRGIDAPTDVLSFPADEPPMTCPRLDHYGLSVQTEAELDAVLAKAKAWQARDDRVDIIDKKTDDHGMLAITSIYVRYLLPMMVEIQWWDWKGNR